MPRYVDAEELYLAIVNKGQSSTRYKLGENWELNGQEIREVLDDIPTADVQEIKHGQWESNRNITPCVVCSECAYYVLHEYKFCPNCGAKMDL